MRWVSVVGLSVRGSVMSEVGYEDPSSLTQGERDREEFLDEIIAESINPYSGKRRSPTGETFDFEEASTGQIVQEHATKEYDQKRNGESIMLSELAREAIEWGYNSPMMTAGQRPDSTVVANEYLQQFGDFTVQDIIDTLLNEYGVDQNVIDWINAAPGEEVRQNWLARNVSPVLTGIIRAHEGFQVSADEVPVQIGWESDLNPLIEATPDWHDARGILGDKDSLANLILPTSPEEAAAFFGMYIGTGVVLNGVVRGSRFLQAAAQQRRWSGQWPYNPLEGELVPAWMGPQSQSRLTGAGLVDDFIDGTVTPAQRAISEARISGLLPEKGGLTQLTEAVDWAFKEVPQTLETMTPTSWVGLPQASTLTQRLNPFSLPARAGLRELEQHLSALEGVKEQTADIEGYNPFIEDGWYSRLTHGIQQAVDELDVHLGFAERVGNQREQRVVPNERIQNESRIPDDIKDYKGLVVRLGEMSPFDPKYEELRRRIFDLGNDMAKRFEFDIAIESERGFLPVWESFGMSELEYLDAQLEFAARGLAEAKPGAEEVEYYTSGHRNEDGEFDSFPVPTEGDDWVEIIGKIEDRIVNLLPGVESITGPGKGLVFPGYEEFVGDPLFQEFVKLGERVSLAEKDRTLEPWSEESSAIMGTEPFDWLAFSRSRGYSEEEIADFRRWLEVEGELSAKYPDDPDFTAAITHDWQSQQTDLLAAIGLIREMYSPDNLGTLINAPLGGEVGLDKAGLREFVDEWDGVVEDGGEYGGEYFPDARNIQEVSPETMELLRSLSDEDLFDLYERMEYDFAKDAWAEVPRVEVAGIPGIGPGEGVPGSLGPAGYVPRKPERVVRNPELSDDEYSMLVSQWSKEEAALSVVDPYDMPNPSDPDYEEWSKLPIWEKLEMTNVEYHQRKDALARLEEHIWGEESLDLVPIPREATQWGPPKAQGLPRPQSPQELIQGMPSVNGIVLPGDEPLWKP